MTEKSRFCGQRSDNFGEDRAGCEACTASSMDDSKPIVVIDSGLGGLTVVRALRKTLPMQDIVYFGDTARLPYGSKTAATVTSFVKQIIQYLRSIDPKHVVIACNTATALSMPASGPHSPVYRSAA